MGRKFVGIAGAVALGLTVVIGATGNLSTQHGVQHSVSQESRPSVIQPTPTV